MGKNVSFPEIYTITLGSQRESEDTITTKINNYICKNKRKGIGIGREKSDLAFAMY